MPKKVDLTEAQTEALKVLKGADAHADSEGYVSLLALEGVNGGTMEALVDKGLVEPKLGTIDAWYRLTKDGKKAA